MSDFTDFLNDNAGYYAALGGLAGVSQRNRLLETQHRQLQLQSEQARKMAAHVARVEALESERLGVEEERLELERRRIAADQKRTAADQERRDEIREMRRCLSRLMTELDTLTRGFGETAAPNSPELTVRLANLRVGCEILTARDAFEDLSDMQALANFDRDLAIFTGQMARQGSPWSDPAARVAEEQYARSIVVQDAIKLLQDTSAPVAILCAKPLYAFSGSEICNLQDRILDMQKVFPERTADLEHRLGESCPCFTPDTMPLIRALNSMTSGDKSLKAFLSSVNCEEGQIFGNDGKAGEKFRELADRLEWAISECGTWSDAVAKARAKLTRIRDAAKLGDYLTAERLLVAAPLEVENFDYLELRERVFAWSKALTHQDMTWNKTKDEVAALLSSKSIKHYISRFSLRRDCAAILARYFEQIEAFRQHAQSLPECEYKTAALELLSRNEKIAVTLRKRARAAETKHAIGFVTYLIVIMVVCFSVPSGLHALRNYQKAAMKERGKGDARETKNQEVAVDAPTGNISGATTSEAHISDYSILSTERLQELADADDPVAMSQLCYRYGQGVGVARDDQKSFSYALRAADKNFPYGLVTAAQMYYAGVGVEEDVEKGLELARKASNLGDIRGTYLVGQGIILSSHDRAAEAIPWLKKAADAGDSDAMVKLGAIYTNPHKGVTPNPTLALEYAKRADALGNKDGSELVQLLETQAALEKIQVGH